MPNLKLLADYPDAVARLEAVASGSKTVDTLFGLSSKVSMRDAGISSDSTQEGASCAAPAGTHFAAGGLANVSAVNNHEVASSTNMCDMKTGAPDLNADSASSSTTPAPAPVVCKLERVDSAAASSAAAAFAAADATAILSLIRFTLPQAITARSKIGSVIHSDPDAHAPPLPGESSGASHTSRYASTQLFVSFIEQLLIQTLLLFSIFAFTAQRWHEAAAQREPSRSQAHASRYCVPVSRHRCNRRVRRSSRTIDAVALVSFSFLCFLYHFSLFHVVF